MLEILTGTGLATAAGLNAALPLLVLGALDRWTPLIGLGADWQWLSNDWVLGVLALVLLLDVMADKVPGIDHLNDLAQTVVRPTAGGLAFGAGSGAQTVAVTAPEAFTTSRGWVPVAIGVLLALGIHLLKSAGRAAVNATTLGVGGPVVSAVEDATSLALTAAAVLVPVLVVALLTSTLWAGAVLLRRRGRRRPTQRAEASP